MLEVSSMNRRRAVLVVPGSDQRKIAKALALDVDEVVLDLEDAVTPANKSAARAVVLDTIATATTSAAISVRINSIDSPWAADDLAALAAADPRLSSVVVPKVQSSTDLEVADTALGAHPARLQALIETPAGVSYIDQICTATPRLDAVIIGYADLGAALGRERNLPTHRWAAIQDRVLIAARTAGIAAIDGPHLGIADDDDFKTAVRWIRETGFDGKWVIHPAQVATTTSDFTPTADAVEQARRILDALDLAESRGAGAAQLDGQMLDEAVAVSARRTLLQAKEQ